MLIAFLQTHKHTLTAAALKAALLGVIAPTILIAAPNLAVPPCQMAR